MYIKEVKSEMNKNCLGKTLVIGLIVLFVGASVLPGVGGKINQFVTINEPQTMECDWEDDFESYTLYQFLDGGPDDGGWEGWAGTPAAGAYVTNNQSHSSSQSVELVGMADLVHKYSEVTSGNWTFTVWQYIPEDFVGETYFILCDWYEDGGASTHWAVQLRCSSIDGLISSEFGEENLPLILGQWVEIRVEIDFGADEKTIYYDGDDLVTSSWTAGMNPDGFLNLGCVDLWSNGASNVYYDDFCLEGEAGADPDLTCEGELRWENVGASSALEGEFIVKNIGGDGSLLDWEITDNPSWGEWTFTPSSGDDLTPEDGDFTVVVDAIAPPDVGNEYNGKVRVENKENPDDFCEIVVFISTPRSRTIQSTLLERVLESFPNAFPVLRYVLGL